MANLINPYTFSQQEKSTITPTSPNGDSNSDFWNDEQFASLRSNIRKHYREEQKGACCYCKSNLSHTGPGNCEIEHIAPRSRYKNFIFEPKNLAVSCQDCNRAKSDVDTIKPSSNKKPRKRYPIASNSFYIVHPHIDRYADHIKNDGDFYIPETDKGRFTVSACKLDLRLHQYGYTGDSNFLELLALTSELAKKMKNGAEISPSIKQFERFLDGLK
ncbi:HNH endonuclease [Pseudoalteromonas sp. YIC-656]|uniref:HNH endonuclease n=1 Tax=Pseudoalteromonas pernae TaxID=3118054 RepID=UPI0032429CDE